MAKTFKFPDNFVWGTATSAHQIEGNNKNSDWWAWEYGKENKDLHIEPSGLACDSYNRFEEDFDLSKKLSNNAVRISVEWARIEPEPGKFSQKELNHYKEVLQSAKDKKLKTFVTLHHFTNPLWLSKMGDWRNLSTPSLFARYAKKCAQELGELTDVFLTINEPQVYALLSYTTGTWPPNKKNPFYSLLVQINMMRAHKKAYDSIKSVKDVPVGIVKHIVWYEAVKRKNNWHDRLLAKFMYWLNDGVFLDPLRNKLDLIGLNYYFTSRFYNFRVKNPDARVSDLNWWINPEGLLNVLLDLKKYGLPIYITENGVADNEDRVRSDVLQEMLVACAKSLEKEVPLRGYFYWSLIDNYEWHRGFWPRFGLVEIDRNDNLKRKPRKSFYFYADICKKNQITF